MGAHVNTNRVLTDLQLSNIMSSLEQTPLEQPDKLLHISLVLGHRSQRVHGALVASGNRPVPVWETATFQSWSRSVCRHSIVTVSGTLTSRPDVRAFLASVIDCIRASDVHVLWALRGLSSVLDPTVISIVNVIKYLTHQALRHAGLHTEKSIAVTCQRIETARDDDYIEWSKILAAVLGRLNAVFIVVDSDIFTVGRTAAENGPKSMKEVFTLVFGEMAAARAQTTVKVLLAEYGVPSTRSGITPQQTTGEMLTINVGGPRVPASRACFVTRIRGGGAIRSGMQRGMGLGRRKL